MQDVVQRKITKPTSEPQPVRVLRSAGTDEDAAAIKASLGFGWSSLMPMISLLIVAGAVALMIAHFSGPRASRRSAPASANLADERYLPHQAHTAWAMASDDPADGADEPLAYAKQLFAQNCSACHGSSAQGLPRQGANLRTSTFLAQHTDEEMLAFLKSGRQPSDPQSLLKLPMPPRGGNPSLTDDRLLDIVQYLRLLQRRSDAAQAISVGPEESAG
jgi:disulfide bond formation protein DsbB